MAEGARLKSGYAGNRIEGSNPSLGDMAELADAAGSIIAFRERVIIQPAGVSAPSGFDPRYPHQAINGIRNHFLWNRFRVTARKGKEKVSGAFCHLFHPARSYGL